MKNRETYSNLDQNWHWPEKTWFRERLSAIKARENEERRKPIVANQATQEPREPADANVDPLKIG